VIVDQARYRDGRRLPFAEIGDALEEIRAQGSSDFLWIGMKDPSTETFDRVSDALHLHPLAVEDAATSHQRPKLERYEDMLFAVFKTVRYCPHERLTTANDVVETGDVMAFVGREFVVTVRHGDHSALGVVRKKLENDPEHLATGPSAVLHAVADLVVDDYLAVVDKLQDDIEELEISVFSSRGARNVEQVYHLKREVLELKRAVAPLAGPLHQLSERPIRLVAPEIRQYFRDVEDHLSRVREQVSAFDELLTSILQASLAQLTVAENEDMRKISAWVAILAVPTMIAGIYGMNFDVMPETEWKYGYWVVLACILTICIVLHRYFKHKEWL